MKWVYLGDGVYVRFDDYHIVLATGTPDDIKYIIYLDGNVWQALLEYVQRLHASDTEV